MDVERMTSPMPTVICDIFQLFIDTTLQLLTGFQWRTCCPCALGMTPHQLIWTQIRSVARQEVQREFARGAGDVFLDHRLLVRWQSIDNQTHWLFAPVHHLLQQLDKQLTRQTTLVGGKPESTFGTDGRCRADVPAYACELNFQRIVKPFQHLVQGAVVIKLLRKSSMTRIVVYAYCDRTIC